MVVYVLHLYRCFTYDSTRVTHSAYLVAIHTEVIRLCDHVPDHRIQDELRWPTEHVQLQDLGNRAGQHGSLVISLEINPATSDRRPDVRISLGIGAWPHNKLEPYTYH